jgi:phosphate-selective porin
MKKRIFIVLLLLFFILSIGYSDDINFSGFFQGWFSYGQQNSDTNDVYGFSLKRIGLKAKGDFGKNIKWFIHGGWKGQSAVIRDAYIYISFKKEFNLKFGKFAVPGAKSGALTPTTKLDFIERAMVTQLWGYNMTLSGYRTIGIQFDGKLLNKKLYYAFMIGNNSTGRMFTPSVKSGTYSKLRTDILLAGRVEVFPVSGLSMGSFYIQTKNIAAVSKSNSYGFHLFYIKNNFNFKTEYLKGTLSLDFGENAQRDENYSGILLKLGYKIEKFEPIIRYDTYIPDKDSYDFRYVEKYNNFTIGLNYFYSKNVKVQINYVIRKEQMETGHSELENNLFYIQIQYIF